MRKRESKGGLSVKVRSTRAVKRLNYTLFVRAAVHGRVDTGRTLLVR